VGAVGRRSALDGDAARKPCTRSWNGSLGERSCLIQGETAGAPASYWLANASPGRMHDDNLLKILPY